MATRLWAVLDANGNIVKTFANKKELRAYELGGENAPLINQFLDSQTYDMTTERGKTAQRTRDAKTIARFLAWRQETQQAA